MRVNPIRSVVAIVGGVFLLGFMDATLERALVSALSEGVPATEAAYVAVRNRPMVLGITLATHALASTLAGYIIAMVSGAHEVRHAMVAAALLGVLYASTFMNDNALLPPVWVRLAMLVVTPPAIVAGAHIRAEARTIHAEQAGAVRPEKERRQGVPADREERRQGVPADKERS
jgi:hypothetical protein